MQLNSKIFFIFILLTIQSAFADSNQGEGATIRVDRYEEVLGKYVGEDGNVDYAGLLKNRAGLDQYLSSIAEYPRVNYETWGRSEQIAFWINAYNALVLRYIIDNYPIRPTAVKSFLFPKNSIRQIPNVLEGENYEVLGAAVSLDKIQNKILIGEFAEPRVAVALACGARGCPWLYKKAYVGEKLDEQLKESAQNFFHREDVIQIAEETRRVKVSAILRPFAQGLISQTATDDSFAKLLPQERAVLRYAYVNSPPHTKLALSKGEWLFSYGEIDWTLNDSKR